MKVLKAIVYSNIWVSVSVATYLLASYDLLGLDFDWSLVAFVFFATLFTYNFQRIVKFRKNFPIKTERSVWLKENIGLLKILSIAGAIGCLALAFTLSFETMVTMGLLGIISVLYATPFLKNNDSLRDIPHIKIYLIAFTWAITALIPILNLNTSIPYTDWLLMILEKTLYILAITIPFDIRDMEYDQKSKKTIPQLIGEMPAILLALSLLAIHTIISIEVYDTRIITPLIVANILTGIAIFFARNKRKELYFTGLMDASPIWTFLIIHFML